MRGRIYPAMLTDPGWFPDRLDWRNRLIRMVAVDLSTLRDSAFLDGRTPLSRTDGEPQVVSLDYFIANVPQANHPVGWIWHEGFCGSTLLARCLTVEGHALCLKEPQVLVDLADWHASGPGDEKGVFEAALHAVIAKLAQPWGDGERIVIKPSNWVNTIKREVSEAAPNAAGLCVLGGAEEFMVAVLRGGRERIRYVLDLKEHLLRARPHFNVAFATVLAEPPETPDALLRHLAATHAIQRLILDATAPVARGGTSHTVLHFPDWLDTPLDSARRAAIALDLAVSAQGLSRSVDGALQVHSKNAAEAFSTDRDASANAAILAMHGDRISQAIDAVRPVAQAVGRSGRA